MSTLDQGAPGNVRPAHPVEPPFPRIQEVKAAQPPTEERVTARELDALRAVRVLEERFVNLRRKAQLADENLLATEEKLVHEIKDLTRELTDMRRTLADMRETLGSVQGEMAHAASIYDVKALEKYLSYWQPMDFVTHEELARTRNLLKRQGGS